MINLERAEGLSGKAAAGKVLTFRCSDFTAPFLCLEAPAPGFAGMPELTQLPACLWFFRVPPLDALRETRQT